MPDQEPQAPANSSELASFGEELRREREIRGISLKEIADATKISRRFLEAVERNDHKTLPAPVFTRGFVREYARYLGLNTEEMVNRYNFAAENDDRVEKPPHIEKYPRSPVRDITPRPPAKRGIPSTLFRINGNVVILVLLVGALIAVAWWAVQQREERTRHADRLPSMDRVARPVVPVAEAVPAPEVAADEGLRLSVEVLRDAWVTLDADGRNVVNSELKAGDQRTFEASEAFLFRTVGNAAGLKLTLNGFPVTSLGGEGEVIRNRTFDRAALETLRAASGGVPAQADP
ncbi:MAG TPA: RodZ domain-containing protein [Thermoanaerobaculia bacterium]